MRVESLTVENFRSITSAKRIPFSNYTVLIGPNNEGKSNVLKALDLAMTTLQHWRPRVVRGADGKSIMFPPDKRYRHYESGYNWLRDFPIDLQSKKKSSSSTSITIEFKLEDSEVDAFVAAVGSNLNGTLPIKISYSRDEFDISIPKPGRGHVTLNKKTTRIASFISERIRFDYVPAVRTAGSAEDVVRKLVSNELKILDKDDNFIEALNLISEMQRPILEALSESITSTVSAFLPSVKEVRIRSSQAARADVLRRSVQIDVNDGVQTDISQKGDGVQSLVALALMRHASDSQSSHFNSIIAIEEPESHLHPKAIRDLRDVITNLSKSSQVILSSHSPLVVKWGGDTSTIVVSGSRAVVAKKLSEIRDCLGILVSDNLSSVEFALIVEGSFDRNIFEKLINARGSDVLKSIFSESRFKIHPIGGAGKLSYCINNFEQNILGFHVFLDNDQAAKSEITQSISRKLISDTEYNLCSCAGMVESELEDAINPKIYRDKIVERYGVDVNDSSFGGNQKWSVRIKKCFEVSGKIWNTDADSEIKEIISTAFSKSKIEESLIDQKSQAIFKVLEILELRAAKASAAN